MSKSVKQEQAREVTKQQLLEWATFLYAQYEKKKLKDVAAKNK